MKWIKRLCSFIFLCILITGGILTYQGYTDYREAIEAKSVEEMSAEIESIDNYTTLDELPQTYIDAVLSVEDKRFYSHPGIDPIAIGRALVNDIKAAVRSPSSLRKISTLHRIKRSCGRLRRCLWLLRSSRF